MERFPVVLSTSGDRDEVRTNSLGGNGHAGTQVRRCQSVGTVMSRLLRAQEHMRLLLAGATPHRRVVDRIGLTR